MPLKIVIAASDLASRNRLAVELGKGHGFKIISLAVNLSEAFTYAEATEPDLVVLSLDLCALPEFENMKSLFYALDARWIKFRTDFSTQALYSNPPQSKPEPEPMLDLRMTPETMRQQIDRVMVWKRNFGKRPGPIVSRTKPPKSSRIVLIGASTGGVDALLALLSNFPADCPPTAIVQHTGQVFSNSLVRLLERRCAATVVAAQDGLALRSGMVCVAAGTAGHLHLRSGTSLVCAVKPGPLTSGHVPSVDELFQSAVPIAANVVGVLLTGMGKDGAAGLLALRRNGAITIAQDEATSVVYGMPKAAWDMGAVQHRLPIQKIAAEVLRAATIPKNAAAL